MQNINPEAKTDKTGSHYELAECRSGDFLSLMDMYDLFSPRPASQGLPPVQTEACQKWVKHLINIGENFLTWRDKKVIGHAALIPDLSKGDCEFVIFIDRLYRNRGIGTELSHHVISKAKTLGLKSIWATVEIHNIRAMSMCKKLGFEFKEMKHSKEKSYCCGVSSWMNCNERSKALRYNRLLEAKEVGTKLITSCPKCQVHLSCLTKDYEDFSSIEIMDFSEFLVDMVNIIDTEKDKESKK